MFRAGWLQQLQFLLLYSLAFLIPFPYIYANVALMALAFVWLLQVRPLQLFRSIYERKIIWAYILYFLLFAASYFYSENKEQALFDTSSKTFLLILPVIIGAGMSLSKKHFQNTAFAFIGGVTFIAISSSYDAYYAWKQSGDLNKLFYHSLVEKQDANAVYQALYTFFSMSLLLIYKWTNFFNGNRRFLKYLVLAIHITFFLLLSARMLMLLAIVFLVPYYLLYIFKTDISTRKIALTLGIFAVLTCFIVVTKNPIKNRFMDFFNKSTKVAFLDDYSTTKEEDFNTLALRLFLWRIGVENISEKNIWLTGCGSGDAQAMQNAKMKEHGVRNIHEDLALRSPLYNANLHNMYLQSLMMIGIFGMILLFIITIHPFTLYKKELLYNSFLPFHVSTIFFMMQESMFQTQAGLAYYSFFSAIYYSLHYTEKQVKSELI